jgi:hypothetical protein
MKRGLSNYLTECTKLFLVHNTNIQGKNNVREAECEFSLVATHEGNLEWHEVQIMMAYTGRFIMFSLITNIYNKKTKGPTLMELFTATGKLKEGFFDN